MNRTQAEEWVAARFPGADGATRMALIDGAMASRACYFCGKVLDARAGFIETVSQPDGTRRDFCSAECLHWQLHEDEKS